MRKTKNNSCLSLVETFKKAFLRDLTKHSERWAAEYNNPKSKQDTQYLALDLDLVLDAMDELCSTAKVVDKLRQIQEKNRT